jgi:Flp pilus assembly pilin Flp
MNMQGRRRAIFLRRLLDESGQDIIEYGLLASIIAIAGILFLPTIATKMGANFSGWGNAVHNLWAPNNPASASP